MSILFVCGVFDSATQSYGRPIFLPARGAATRSFIDEVNRKAEDNSLYNHPADFELRCLATFDESTGEFTNLDGAELLCRGKDVKNHDAS